MNDKSVSLPMDVKENYVKELETKLQVAVEALEFCANSGNDEYSTLQKSKEALEKIKT